MPQPDRQENGTRDANMELPATREFIERENAETLASFKAKPSLIEEQAGFESAQKTEAYRKRQVYELIQNSSDAIWTQEKPGTIKVLLTEKALYCANQGAPISAGGVRAILQAYMSTRRGEEMGRYGLGFKSVLGVTNRPEFHGSNVSFLFDKNWAKSVINEAVEIANQDETDFPILRLAKPIDSAEYASRDAILSILLKNATTVVKLPFDSNRHDWLHTDLKEFPAEFLIFAPRVNTLILEDLTSDTLRKFRRERHKGKTIIVDALGENETRDRRTAWSVFTGVAKPSKAAIDEAGYQSARSEIRITWAVPDSGRGNFWAFFPLVKERMSLGGILNAAWQLDGQRQNIQDGKFNYEILRKAITLIFDNLPNLVDENDPGSILDLYPARLAERENFDQKLSVAFYGESRNRETLPDTSGVLRPITALKLPPSNRSGLLNSDAVEAWGECPTLPLGWAHPTTIRTEQRSARIDGLRAAPDYLRGGLELPPEFDIGDLNLILRAPVREWLEALVEPANVENLANRKDSEHEARAEASFYAIKAAANVLDDTAIQEGVMDEVRSARIILTNDGRFVALSDGVFLPADEDQNHNYKDVNVIHDDLITVNGMSGVLQSEPLGIHTVDAASRLKSLLASADIERFITKDWEALWRLVDEVEVDQATVNSSEGIILDHFNRVDLEVSAELRIRNLDGTFIRLNSVLLPGEIVKSDDEDGKDAIVDKEFHQKHLHILERLGALSEPQLEKGNRIERYFEHYRNEAKTLFYEKMTRGGNPQDRLLDFDRSVMAGPLDPLFRLSKNARANFTERLLEFHEEHQKWSFRHSTQTANYPTVEIDSPVIWMIKKYGRLRTAYSSSKVENAVGPGLADWADFLPVAQVTLEAAELLNLRNSFDKIDPDIIGNAIDESGSRSPILSNPAKFKKPKDLGMFLAQCCEVVESPHKIPCLIGNDVKSENTTEVTVVDAKSQALLDQLVGRNIPHIVVQTASDAKKLITNWGLKNPDIPIEVITVPSGGELPVGDFFPALGFQLNESQEDYTITACSSIRIEVSDGSGQSKETNYLAEGMAIYWNDSLDRESLLVYVLDTLGLKLSNYEREGILENRLLQDQQERRQQVINEKDLNRKLILAVGGIEPMKKQLPTALLEFYKETDEGLSEDVVAQLFLDVFGIESLKKLKDDLRIAGFQSPSIWAGGIQTRKFVSELGFPDEYAGFEKSKPPSEIEVLGPSTLPPLHDFQDVSAKRIKSLFLAGANGRRGMLSLPTGAGKTRVAVEAIVRTIRDDNFPSPILWIAQSNELCEQAVQSWSEMWHALGSEESLSINRLWGGNDAVKNATGHQIVISTVKKMEFVIDNSNYNWLKECSAIVIDEAHHSIAPVYTKILNWAGISFSSTRCPLMGLSATAYRGAEEEAARLVKRYGSNRLDEGIFPGDDPYRHLQKMSVLADVDHEILKGIDINLEPNELDELERLKKIPSAALERLGSNVGRNRAILKKIKELPDHWPILVFGPSVDHAKSLAAILVREGISAASVSAETDKSARRYYIDKFRRGEIRVLTNFGVLTTGFDAPATRAIIVGRPTYSPILYQQMIGRGLRGTKNGGKERCLIVNVEDTFAQFGEALAFTGFEYLWDPKE